MRKKWVAVTWRTQPMGPQGTLKVPRESSHSLPRLPNFCTIYGPGQRVCLQDDVAIS